MLTRFVRVTLGRNHQATVLPFGVSGECFLLSTNVRSCGIDFIVSLGLKVVENLVVLGRVSDACSRRWVCSMGVSLEKRTGLGIDIPKGHQSKDDPWLGVLRNEGHIAGLVFET